MTMFSFRVDDHEAALTQQWADSLGIDRSALLRAALHRHLVLLAADHDVLSWNTLPLTPAESTLGEIAEWGPAEDWTDWADAAR